MASNLDEPWHVEFNQKDVEQALRSLKIGKSIGCDEVPNRLLREGAELLSYPIYQIFRRSIRDRIFPECWKLADIIPMPKKRTPSLTDFRPISLTPVISKIFESLILRSVYPHILSLFGPSQHAFRKYGSTVSALIHMHDSITRYLDSVDVAAVRMTCLDLTKAFDMMRYDILLNRLHASGVNRGFIA